MKKKLIALFACFALCASFVPALAIANPADDEVAETENDAELVAQVDDEEGTEPVAQESGGQLDFTGATVSGNTLSYEGGYKVEVTADGATWNGTSLKLPDNTRVAFKFIPPAGYSGNASLLFDGTAIPFSEDGTLVYPVDFSSKNVIPVEFNPGAGPQKTREVKLTIDEASLPMLASKCRLKIGYGDDNDVEFTVADNGKPITVSEDTLKRTLISFTIDTRYFIPTAIVNGKSFETFDEGSTPDDPSRVNIVVELTGDDAAADEYNVNLSIGAKANVDLQAQNVSRASASYMLVENGQALVGDVANTEIDLTINDTAIDPEVPGAVATFDLGAQLNGQAATTTEAPLNITMTLDTSVYPAANYVVVRNHEGTRTELTTTYDPATGALSYESDRFSDYSLVDKDAAATKGTDKTTLAKTGDPLTAGGVVFVGLVALGAAAFATRKLRENLQRQ